MITPQTAEKMSQEGMLIEMPEGFQNNIFQPPKRELN